MIDLQQFKTKLEKEINTNSTYMYIMYDAVWDWDLSITDNFDNTTVHVHVQVYIH